MAELIVDDLQYGYPGVVESVFNDGEVAWPRGLKTHEIRGVELVVKRPWQTLPIGVGRSVNTKIAAVEALQLIGGVLHPELLVKASKAFGEFMDGGTFHGGYGQRVRSQLPAVQRRLLKDPDTRQAVVTLWDPQHDLFTSDAKDYPCTIALQFIVRNHTLELHTHMRSNDVWRGLAYDAFVFTQLQQAMAASLDFECGDYHHHVVSLHLYDTDVPAVMKMLEAPTEPLAWMMGSLIRQPMTYELVMLVARGLLRGKDVTVESNSTLGWYTEVLRDIVS